MLNGQCDYALAMRQLAKWQAVKQQLQHSHQFDLVPSSILTVHWLHCLLPPITLPNREYRLSITRQMWLYIHMSKRAQ